MAHFAQIDGNSMVTQVIVVHNNELLDNDVESEQKGINFCRSLFGENTQWVQTSYNGNQRKNYAGIGFVYDSNRNAFIPPKPFNSWILNETTCRWEAPVSYPADGQRYVWNENNIQWEVVTE